MILPSGTRKTEATRVFGVVCAVLVSSACQGRWELVPDRDDTVVGIRTERWKLIIDSRQSGHELYDLVHDPGEQMNVIGQHGGVAEELEARLWAEISRECPGDTGPVCDPEWDRAEEQEVLARLRALGYLDWVEEHQQRAVSDT